MAKKNDKALNKALDAAIEDLLKDYKGAMKKATEFAVSEAKECFMTKAHTCLEEYYRAYSQEQYSRTQTLGSAFLPYERIKRGTDSIVGSVGVEYSPESLEANYPPPQYYERKRGPNAGDAALAHTGYYGSAKYQPVDAWWVIRNYLLGIHPDFGKRGETTVLPGVYGHTDDASPNEKMNKFIEDYGKQFDEDMLTSILGQIAKKL